MRVGGCGNGGRARARVAGERGEVVGSRKVGEARGRPPQRAAIGRDRAR